MRRPSRPSDFVHQLVSERARQNVREPWLSADLHSVFAWTQYMYRNISHTNSLVVRDRISREVLQKLPGPLLPGANLQHVKWHFADLTNLDLGMADLSDANLLHAHLTGANLNKAVLTRCILAGATLTRCNLRGADLTGAYLAFADLSESSLDDAVLTGALYSDETRWPVNFDPQSRGAILTNSEWEARANALLPELRATTHRVKVYNRRAKMLAKILWWIVPITLVVDIIVVVYILL